MAQIFQIQINSVLFIYLTTTILLYIGYTAYMIQKNNYRVMMNQRFWMVNLQVGSSNCFTASEPLYEALPASLER